MSVEEEIVKKGETLRDICLIRKVIEEIDEEVVADGINIKGMLFADDFVRKIDQVISLIERELPGWAKEIAKNTFDLRRGFIIWGPIKKEV